MRPRATGWLRSAAPPILLLALTAYLWRFGYQFGVGDQDELLPPVMALLNPTLFGEDWYVQLQRDGFNVRTPFTWLVAGPSLVLGLFGGVAALWAIGMAGVLVGIAAIGRALGASHEVAAAAAFAAVALTPTWTLGGNAIAYPQLVPELLAWALVLPGVALLLRAKPWLAGALVGVAAWLQVLAAALAAASLGLALIIVGAIRSDRSALLDALRFGASALLVALPFVAFVGIDYLAAPAPAVEAAGLSTFRIIAELRGPHHYLPLEFGGGRYARFALLTAAALVGLVWLRRREMLVHGAFLLVWLGVVATILGAGFVAIEGLESVTVAKLQLFKLTVLVQTVLTVVLVFAISARWRTPTSIVPTRAQLSPGPIWMAAAAIVVLTAALIATNTWRPAALFQPLQHARSDQHRVEMWAASETAEDALFVVPPSNTTFRTHARRSVAINHKPTPFDDRLMHEWLERLLVVAPLEPPARGADFLGMLDAAYHSAAPDHWPGVASTFGARYALVDLRLTTRLSADDAVVAAGPWAIFALSPEVVDP